MLHKLSPAFLFRSLVDKSETNTCLLWLMPFLDGDRDVVSNNDSALVDELGIMLFWLQRPAGCTDNIDVICYSLFQRLGFATLCLTRFFRRSGRGLK